MKKKLFVILKIALLLFVVVSCNTQKSDTKKVTLVLDWIPNTNHTGIFVAKDLGYFKDEGINIDIVQPEKDSAASIVGTGKAEFGIYFQPNMIKRYFQNVKITAIAALLQKNTAGLMCLKSLNANSPKELNGKRYATFEDEIDDATVKAIVGNDVKMIPSESTNALAGLLANQYDYIMVYSNWDLIYAKLKGINVNFFYLSDYEPKFDYYTPVLIANNDFLEKNPELVKRFLKALEKGYRYAVKNPEKAADILISNAPEGNEKLIKESQKNIAKYYLTKNGEWGTIDKDKWDIFYNWLYENKIINKKIESGAGFTNEYLKR